VYLDIVKAAKFEAVIQSSITDCNGNRLCLETKKVGDKDFIGVGTGCEQRFYWTNQEYMELTQEDYDNSNASAAKGSGARRGLAIDETTQRWVITTEGGCLQQLHDFGEEGSGTRYEAGHRLGLDPSCSTGFSTEFFAIVSPTWEDQKLHGLDQPFALVESHPNRTRRLAFHVNSTTPYQLDGENCSCVGEPDRNDLESLLVSHAHVHVKYPNDGDYFYGRDHCDAGVFHSIVFPPSPPPPVLGRAPPPAPPFQFHQVKVVIGAFTTSGLFFFACCACCWFGLNGRVRSTGRSKWPGVAGDRIDRPPLGRADDRGYFPTQGAARTPLLADSEKGFFLHIFE
jgi:hypothetical protein